MTKLDYYERHLLAMAVKACAEGDDRFSMRPDGTLITDHHVYAKDTLADALTALLTDLGVQVPERPSEEAVEKERDASRRAELIHHWTGGTLAYLQDLHARDPLLAAAVLEAG